MKLIRLLILAGSAVLLSLQTMRAASGYSVRQLFELGTDSQGTSRSFAGNGFADTESRVRVLNNLGEVLYAHGDRRPSIWLPKANYGRPAGANDLTGFASLPNRSALGFTDRGVFYHFSADPTRPNDPLESIYQVYQGTSNGEGAIASGYRFEDLPSLDDGEHVRRQVYYAQGITLSGNLVGKSWGEIRLSDLPSTPFNWDRDPRGLQGLFRNRTFIPLPGEAGLPVCPTRPALVYNIRAQSPAGTFLILRSDSCGNTLYHTLAVSSSTGERVVSRNGGGFIPAVNPLATRLALNDAGDVAGLDETGLWISPFVGEVRRLNFTDIQDVRFNQAGQLFFVRANDVHLWAEDGSVVPLGLSLPALGYNTNFTLRDINERAQILVGVKSSANGKNYAALLSPVLNVRLTVSTNQVGAGETIVVNASITSLSDSLLTAIAPADALLWNGTGEWKTLSGPTPSQPLALAPGEETNLQWQLQGLKIGKGRFSLAMQAKVVVDSIKTLPVFSENVTIHKGGPDLYILGGDGLDIGLGQFHTVPVEAQTERRNIASNKQTEFYFELKNAGNETNKFVLHAAEDNVPGWNFVYDALEDITTSIRSPEGWTTRDLAPGETTVISLVMTPLTATVGSEASIRIFASSTTAPLEPVDLIEMRATVQSLLVTSNPDDAVVGEYVEVTARFQNPLPTPLSEITAEIRLLEAGHGYAVDSIRPARIATLAPGAVAEFTQKFAMTNKGSVKFLGVIRGTKPGLQPYSAQANSLPLPVGLVQLVQVNPIQVLPDATLIQGKRTVFFVAMINSSDSKKLMTFDFEIDGIPYSEPFTADGVGGAFFTTNDFTLDGAEVEVSGRIRLKNGLTDIEYPGSSFTNKIEAVNARRLQYAFSYLEFASKYHIPSVTRAQASAIERIDSAFLKGVYPMPEEPPSDATFPSTINWPDRFPLSWELIMAWGDGTARRMSLDRLILIFPRHATVWPTIPNLGEAAGWAYRRPHPIKHVVSVVGNLVTPNYPGNVSAHEIGHTFGFDDVPTPTARTVPDGYWVGERMVFSQAFDFMDYAVPAWINQTHYEFLVQEFTKPALDPEVLLVNGTIAANGTVTAFPWHSVFVSDPDAPQGAGTHAIEFRDNTGKLIASHPFTPGFEAIGDTFSTNQTHEASVTMNSAPFSFALPRPTNLASVRLVKGAQLLYERLVTPHAPVVEFIAPAGGEILTPRQLFQPRWAATDADGGELSSTLFFSKNGVSDWVVVSDLLITNETDWETPDQPTRMARFKLQTTDGVNTTERLSPEFAIQGTGSRVVASAGANQFVTTGVSITLDARGSHATTGEPVTFLWRSVSAPAGEKPALTGGNTAQPAFTPQVAGSYLFRLTVSDSAGQKAEALTAVYATETLLVLHALRINDTIELSWLASSTTADYEVQLTENLGTPLGWQPAPSTPPALRDGQWSITVPASERIRFFRLHRKGDSSIDFPISLAADQALRLGDAVLKLAALDLGAHQLITSGPGRLQVQSATGARGSRIVLNGAGLVEINSLPSTAPFLGALELRGGRVLPNARLLNTAQSVELTDGALVLPADAVLNSSARLMLGGGSVEFNGARGDLGELTLNGEATLNLGSEALSLSFASATLGGPDGKLLINGWLGNGGSSGARRKIFVKALVSADFLARVTFVGIDFASGAERLPTGEIVPLAKAPSVLPANALALLQGYGGVAKSIVTVTGQTFAEAARIVTTQKPAQVYNAGAQVKTSSAVAANDNLLARFWVRKVAPAAGNAQVMFNFELASGTFEKSAQLLVTLSDTTWQMKTIKFKAKAGYLAGAAEVSFWTGYGTQTVEIGGLEVLNYKGITPP